MMTWKFVILYSIGAKEDSFEAVQRFSGRRRKVVVTKEELMYIPLLETLQTLLTNVSVLKEVRLTVYMYMDILFANCTACIQYPCV